MSAETVVLVASGLRDIGGHNYTYTRAVEDELRARGFDVEVLANGSLTTTLAAESGYRAVFSKGTYDFPHGRNPLDSLMLLHAQAGVYASELESALARHIKPPRVIFCHTLADFELVGWGRFLKHRPLPSPLVLMMRETPGFADMGFYRRWLHPYTGLRARALASIRRTAPGLVLATDTEELAADYENIFRGEIRTFPIPAVPVSNRPGAGVPRVITFGYVGDCRPAKGFPRLAPMIHEVLTNDVERDVRFVVQLYRGTYDESANPPGWDEIETLSERFPSHIEIVRGVLSIPAYEQLVSSLDVVLIPNDHPVFRGGSSNVFCESAATGKPVVVTEGTWMASQLARYGGGASFSRSETSSFARAVIKIARAWPQARERAEGFAQEWRSAHNSGTLVDVLLDASSDQLVPSPAARFLR